MNSLAIENDDKNEVMNGYVRKVNKSNIPTCNILGVNIAAVNMNWVIEYLQSNIKDLSGEYVCLSNVHTTVMSYENHEYCEIQNGSIMALPDGGPLSIVGRKRGYKDMARVTGPGLMGEIFKRSTENGYKHFFYGSKEETLKKLSFNLEKDYPGIQITGMYSPPFHTLTEEEDEEIIKMINNSNSDFVWIGLGAPKQETWMAGHCGKINGLMFGVGAGFDYFAGNIKRAPMWMQKLSMEWFYRLIQEPRRLFSRYIKTNPKFLWLVMRGK